MAGLPGVLAYGLATFVGLWFVDGAAAACDFPAIYNFGSSTSDTGASAILFSPFGTPYGATFSHKLPGRASDGRLIIDFTTETLKLPYLNPYVKSVRSNFRHGANFAIGGATAVRPNISFAASYGLGQTSLDVQIMQFNMFKQQITELYPKLSPRERKKLPVPGEFSKALYTFYMGNNDISKWFFSSMTLDQIKAMLPLMVKQTALAIQNIYANGGRFFWVYNQGPHGCTAITVVMDNPNLPPEAYDENRCVKSHNEISKEFNRLLKERIIELRAELPEAAITYVDMYEAYYMLVSNAKKEGFTDPMKICCGIFEKNTVIWCGTKGLNANKTEVFAGSCKDPKTYINWDGPHLTESANLWLAKRLHSGSFSDPPVSITQACVRGN